MHDLKTLRRLNDERAEADIRLQRQIEKARAKARKASRRAKAQSREDR